VSEYVTINNIKTPFKDNKPGDDWYYCFMKRHPSLSFKKPEQLQTLRKDARKPDIIYDFYDKLEEAYIKNNITELDSDFVNNCDESGFLTDPTKLRALGEKGKALNRVSGGSGRESISVLACISASGSYLPPFIVFKGGAVQARRTSDKSYPGTLYAVSKNGWMEEPLFFNWFEKMFVKYIQTLRLAKNVVNQTALLLFDGHCSHISLRILKLAIENNIVLVKFPSHLTDRLQPLDKCVFGPLKTEWNKLLIKFGKQQIGKGIGRLTKGKFSEILGTLWSNSMKCENIKSGFISTGLFPIDKSKFPESYFDPIDLEHYLQNLKQTSNKNAELPPQESINNNNSEESNLNQSTSFSECPTNQLTSYTQNQKDIDSINTSN